MCSPSRRGSPRGNTLGRKVEQERYDNEEDDEKDEEKDEASWEPGGASWGPLDGLLVAFSGHLGPYWSNLG